MIHIIEMSEPLDGTAWDLGYAWMPCYYSCKIEVNKVPAEVKLNAGSWLWINFDDTSILRSCDAKAMRKYFLAHVQN